LLIRKRVVILPPLSWRLCFV